jgi:hypothetical protein
MEMKDIFPCLTLDCPNHGNCEKCTSRHLKKKSLNYCAFYTGLLDFQDAIAASPESPTAKRLASMIDKKIETFGKRMEKHGRSQKEQEVANFSDY